MSDLEGWSEEMQSAHLYHVLARIEAGTLRERLFAALAREAVKQAAIWADRARRSGTEVPDAWTPTARVRLVAWRVEQIGPESMQSVLAAMKVRGLSVYSPEPPDVLGRENAAARPGPVGHSAEAEGRRHRAVRRGGNLRAAVFGVNDGLVSNVGLILGVAGANAEPTTILLTGVAGLIAGAFSMAAGEYVSVRSQRELFEYQIDLERQELTTYPEEEASELALIYEARGIPAQQVREAADRIIADPDRALDTLAREELGLDPNSLGSEWSASTSSFVAFAIGASVPVLPFALASVDSALTLSVGLSGLALFSVGAALSLFTGRGALQSGVRMLAIGTIAGTATWSIGSLLGVTLG